MRLKSSWRPSHGGRARPDQPDPERREVESGRARLAAFPFNLGTPRDELAPPRPGLRRSPASSPGDAASLRTRAPGLRRHVSSLRRPEESLERSAASLGAVPACLGGTSQACHEAHRAAPRRRKLCASRRRFGTSRGRHGRGAPSLPGRPASLPELGRSMPRLRIAEHACPQACREASQARFRTAQDARSDARVVIWHQRGASLEFRLTGRHRPLPRRSSPAARTLRGRGAAWARRRRARNSRGTRSATPPSSFSRSPAPRVHATKAARKAFYEYYAAFVSTCREAGRLHRGDRNAHFPLGSFPPAITLSLVPPPL